MRLALRRMIFPFAFLLFPFAHAGEAPALSGWKLTWSDEFDGTEIDRTKWDFDKTNGFPTGDGKGVIAGWGNGELQYYTDRKENAYLQDGVLHIRAIKELYEKSGYTSARLKTRKDDKSALFNQLYGRFEIRAKLPLGRGLWPAFWLLPRTDKCGGWAASGEIDILEARGQQSNIVLGTLHYGAGWPNNTHTGKDYALPNKGTIADFHVYALEWEPGEMRWYVDGELYQTQNFWWSTSKRGGKAESEKDLNAWPAPFAHPYYIVLNLAVGGQFLGNPDKATAFPAEFLIDYVRVYEKAAGYGGVKGRGEGKLPFKTAENKKVEK